MREDAKYSGEIKRPAKVTGFQCFVCINESMVV